MFAECARQLDATGWRIRRQKGKSAAATMEKWIEACARKTYGRARNTIHDLGDNCYPDVPLAREPLGFEVKVVKEKSRIWDFDANSHLPSGRYGGIAVYYVFFRYSDEGSHYAILDLVICHGDFINPVHDYVHVNDNIPSFGGYGDIMIRDRKMYVAPTPIALAPGLLGNLTLIGPDGWQVPADLVKVGTLERTETDMIPTRYSFDLDDPRLIIEKRPHSGAGQTHRFAAYRCPQHDLTPVELAPPRTKGENDSAPKVPNFPSTNPAWL